MEITKDTINNMLSLSDEELQKAFCSIGAALGINERIVAANSGKFKHMLASADPKDLERLLSSIDPTRAAQIMKTVENNTKKK
ncbi:MAG: hypothetical protein IJ489_04775 [Clostridia bacterium]|nr:hypothetical protein [Clostridia bacterium]